MHVAGHVEFHKDFLGPLFPKSSQLLKGDGLNFLESFSRRDNTSISECPDDFAVSKLIRNIEEEIGILLFLLFLEGLEEELIIWNKVKDFSEVL